MVCLPIWHWYMFLGDWLKSENGVRLAKMDRMLVGANSTCEWMLFSISAGVTAMFINTCSNGPIMSSWSRGRNIANLHVKRNAVLLFNLPESQGVCHHSSLFVRAPSNDSSVQLHTTNVWSRNVHSRSRWRNTQLIHKFWNFGNIRRTGGDLTLVSQVVQQTTWRSIGSMDRTQKSPRFRKQLTNRSGFQLCKERTSMNHSEMRDEPVEINLFGNNRVTTHLLQIQSRLRHKVTCREEILERGSDDGHRMVSSLNNQHSDQLLDTVHNEISSQFVSFLTQVDQLVRRQVFQMTSVGLQHDGYLTGFSNLTDLLSVVDRPANFEQESGSIRGHSFSALCRICISNHRELVSRRHLRLGHLDRVHSDLEFVSQSGHIVRVKDRFRADIFNSLVQ
ncbi:hypothetical protein OGAPHI_002653 [Ogataea philodendri]|uniref:Uncharacterized protein n=1 Tax=Ogataea philodendri TaxID=1378263 RepID=A0A9P8T788_9ASCO|nr:uncharacterized protein OGAPHI_002653 [Ogataea philodendri]KAH3668898.1 hypothetical protein OGAPHI_002653 [Ogataea philodendri]